MICGLFKEKLDGEIRQIVLFVWLKKYGKVK